MKVMMRVVMVMVVIIYIEKEQNPCWFRSQTHTPIMTVSRYVIASLLHVLPTQLLVMERFGPNILFFFYLFFFDFIFLFLFLLG